MSTPAAHERDRFAGAGRSIPATDLLLITGELVTTSNLTIQDSFDRDRAADIVVHRDPVSRLPMIPASSLTGVLRHEIQARLGADIAATAFGTAADSDQVSVAALQPRDAVAVVGSRTRWRTNNVVDPATRTVRPGGLFTEEVVPADTRFTLLWQVWLPTGLDADADAARRAGEILRAVAAAGSLLGSGQVRLGRRTRAGRGAVRAGSWRARLLNASRSAADARAWFTTPYERTAGLVTGDPAPELSTALAGLALPATVWSAAADAEPPVRRGDLIITGVLAVSEVFDNRTVPSTIRLDPAPEPIDSGAAVKALLRAQARRILEFLALTDDPTATARNRERAAELHRGLFGSHPGDRDRVTRPSRIQVDEAPLIKSAPVVFDRFPIDPLTRATVPHRKGVVEAFAGGSRRLRIVVSGASAAERGLLALVVKDLCAGFGALGGPHRRRMNPGSVVVEFGDGDARTRIAGWNAIRGHRGPTADVRALRDLVRREAAES
ncbi:RAMP superfamily CRISPR-associated protein [Nocardia thailandica]